MFEFSKTNVYSTLHVCWGAQAALYYHYGIPKYELAQKVSGVFAHRVLRPANPLVRGFDEVFWAPHSRHTEVRRADVEKQPALRILAESEEAGLHLLSTDSGRRIFILGHMRAEYERDVARGLPAAPPKHYFVNDDPARPAIFRWRSHAHLLFSNWLNYYVYQATPYDLEKL